MQGPGNNIVHHPPKGLMDHMGWQNDPLPCCGITYVEIAVMPGHVMSSTMDGLKQGYHTECAGTAWIGKGKKNIVHHFDGLIGGVLSPGQKATCCGLTYEWIADHNPSFGHLFTTKDSLTHPKTSIWCAGHVQSKPAPTTMVLAPNEKTNCLKCGWPRSVEGMFNVAGAPFDSIKGVTGVYDGEGCYVHLICQEHCAVCHQQKDDCACCQLCYSYPCGCGEMSAHITASYALHTKTMTMAEVKAKFAENVANSDVLNNDYGSDFPKVLPSVKWACKTCGEHFKDCACPEGPITYQGGKVSWAHLAQASQCLPVPWLRRGQKPVLKHTDKDVAWPNIRPQDHNPVEWSADFYLYQALTSGVLNTQCGCTEHCDHSIRHILAIEDPVEIKEARVALQLLIDQADLTFREYIDMACGGELRHHPSVGAGGAISTNRKTAWAQWKDVRDCVGVQALLDMERLFLDYQSGGGGVCGPKWANAARLLYNRLTGRISPTTFVDQTFSLVHNGGVFLNKRTWKCGDGLKSMQEVVLPAQARDDFETILDYASPEAQKLWAEGWRAINYCRIRAGARPVPLQRTRSLSYCHLCGIPSHLGHSMWRCKKIGRPERVTNKAMVRRIRQRLYHPSLSADFKTLILWPNKLYQVVCGGKTVELNSASLLDYLVEIPDGKRILNIYDYYNSTVILKLPVTKLKGQIWTIRDLIQLNGITIKENSVA